MSAPTRVDDYRLGEAPLGPQLNAIAQAMQSGLREAVIFYSGRLLEALSAQSLTLLNLPASSNMFSNLEELNRLGLFQRPSLDLAHTLRRMSNRARHAISDFTLEDVRLAIFCIDRSLIWHLTDFARGPAFVLPEDAFIFSGEARAGLAPRLLQLVQAVLRDNADTAPIVGLGLAQIAESPAFASLAAETLISAKNLSAADTLLAAALAHAPNDLRLKQLQGLCHRRANRLDAALATFEELYRRNHDDEETAGPYAGVLKMLGDARGDQKLLARSLEIYRAGWLTSSKRSTYLGINAAALACWLGAAGAADIASDVIKFYDMRRGKLAASGLPAALGRNYYDLVTEAEALLLLGETDRARALYSETFASFRARKGDIEGTVAQANRSLRVLGLAPLAP